MASGGAQGDAEKKEAYYLRLHLLVAKYGTEILRARFDHAVPPATIHQKLQLQKCKSTINHAKNKNRISQTQYQQLYPAQGPPKSDDFDVSLLYYLLRNLCGLNGKSKWWNEGDNSKIPETEQSEEADIQRIKNMRNEIQHKHIASLEVAEFEVNWDLMEEVICRLAAKCNRNDMKYKIDEQKTAKLDLVSEEFRSLRANSGYFFEDFQDESKYVTTDTFEKAKNILTDKNIVILTGYPGEGKTTMAARLALSLSQPRNCLKLSNPHDWRYIDLSLKLVDTIFIDDIFGEGAFDQRLVGEWRLYLPQIAMAAKKKAVRVIIASRHYILKESLDEIGSLPLFRDENETTVLLSSADLTEDEKSRILKIQSIRSERVISEKMVRACVEASRGPSEENPDFLFGFPECASMFVRSKEMYSQGAAFFKKPSSHFKSYLEDLYTTKETKDKFLALVAVWAKENKRLAREELRSEETVSDHVKKVAEVFDYDIDQPFLDQLKNSLDSHVGGYLVFDDRREEFMFSHNVVGDMVGLVIGKKKPNEAVEICPRDFLMEYISIDYASNDEFKIVVKEIHFRHLAEKFIYMLLRKNCNSTAKLPSSDEFHRLRRVGERSNVIKIDNTIDYGLIKHKAFSSKQFVQVFIDNIIERDCVKEVFQVPVMKMQGYFFDYGISMKELSMCLLGYAWFSGASTFAKNVFTRKILGNDSFDPSISLILATHSKEIESIDFLLDHGARVTGDVIYIAMHHKNLALLEMFLQRPGTDVNDRGNAVNGNYPLIVAARKGMIESVKCLLRNGADPGVKNAAHMTALHKAIIYKHENVVTCLLDAHAPLDVKGGKFKRTPLHLAADYGDLYLAQRLVRKGASLKVKDHRGHYPIHIAALRGHIDIVRFLLTTDPTQDQWRISSYGSKSMIKGMSLFHIAVWKFKNKPALMDALIERGANPNIQDFFGQTPLFYAIMKKEETAVEKLLTYAKTDKRKSQKQGFTPLHAAIHKRLTKIAKQLAGDSDVNARDKYGRTPLHVACETSDLLMVLSLVIQHGADPRVVTKRGDTVFHILRKKRKTDQKGADPKVINKRKSLCEEAEQFLSERDQDFVARLPRLLNKKGKAVRIIQRRQRRGDDYWQKKINKFSEKLESSSINDAAGGSSAGDVRGRTANESDEDVEADVRDFEPSGMFDNNDIDPIDMHDFDDYDPADMYDAYDFNGADEYDVDDFDMF